MAVAKDLKPEEIIEVWKRGISPQQQDSITQQVLMISADTKAMNELRLFLAQELNKEGRFARAAALYQKVGQVGVDKAKTALLLADSLIAGRQAAVGLRVLDKLEGPVASEPDAYDLRGRALAQLERFDEAIEAFRSAMGTGRIRVSSLNNLVSVMLRADRAADADELLGKIIRDNGANALVLHLRSTVLHRLNRIEDAEEAISAARKLEPSNARLAFHHANLLQVLGRLENSERVAAEGLKEEPDNPQGLSLFSSVHHYKIGSDEFEKMEQATAQLPSLPVTQQISLMFSKAKALVDVGMLHAAFAYYREAGSLKLKLTPARKGDDARHVDGMRRAFLGRTDIGSEGHQDGSPIFVLGMPRSGTSLLEQVLSAHSDIAGIGEQKIISRLINGVRISDDTEIQADANRYFPEDYAPSKAELGERYVIEAAKQTRKQANYTLDKMPPNYRYLGFIFDVLPQATIIHSMRHPIETCVSCYRILFAEGHAWSYDLRLLGQRYRFYYELMQLWDEVFGDRILHVRYEDMTADLENQTRRLVDHVGLAFEEQSLRFHENPNPMRTASVLQVRKPVYSTSVSRWSKHKDLLAPLYDEIGDIVEDYEQKRGLFSRAG